MKITQKKEVPPEKVREMILGGYRASFRDAGAAKNRAKFVAERMGIQVSKLYAQIRELGLREEIAGLREKAGVSSSGRAEGSKYHCSACGSGEHNARSPKCPHYEAP